MTHLEEKAFFRLFQEAYEKCFGNSLINPLSEIESKHFSNEILEQTGLVLGWKSIKNYSFYILNQVVSKQENPSTATLDTLARYVANAPKTDELSRKRDESHFPYWFTYRDSFSGTHKTQSQFSKLSSKKIIINIVLIVSVLVSIVLYLSTNSFKPENFTDDFNAATLESMTRNGWILKDKEANYWNKRDEKAGNLTLFTLEGDNYPDTSKRVGIKNLLLRKINAGCFSTEIHLSNFIPGQNWQQAGILLIEDSTFSSKSVRLSISYNDFFGGYTKPGEILIQVVSSANGDFSKPEEAAHLSIFSNEPSQTSIVQNNLRKSALRIEKRGSNYRFLFATGSDDIFAFKEVISRDLYLKPKYVGIFALKGFVKKTAVIPVRFDFFNLKTFPCQ